MFGSIIDLISAEKNMNDSKSSVIQTISEGGNFTDFEELSFEGKEESKTFLNGALKISALRRDFREAQNKRILDHLLLQNC